MGNFHFLPDHTYTWKRFVFKFDDFWLKFSDLISDFPKIIQIPKNLKRGDEIFLEKPIKSLDEVSYF